VGDDDPAHPVRGRGRPGEGAQKGRGAVLHGYRAREKTCTSASTTLQPAGLHREPGRLVTPTRNMAPTNAPVDPGALVARSFRERGTASWTPTRIVRLPQIEAIPANPPCSQNFNTLFMGPQ